MGLQTLDGCGADGLPCFTHWLSWQIQVSSFPPITKRIAKITAIIIIIAIKNFTGFFNFIISNDSIFVALIIPPVGLIIELISVEAPLFAF